MWQACGCGIVSARAPLMTLTRQISASLDSDHNTMPTSNPFTNILSSAHRQAVILDGGFGTELERHGKDYGEVRSWPTSSNSSLPRLAENVKSRYKVPPFTSSIMQDPLWSARILADDPAAVKRVHRAYYDAGSPFLSRNPW